MQAPTRPIRRSESPVDPGRPLARQTLTVALRVGAILLSSGGTTDEVELAMRAIASSSGLADTQVVVQFGTISISYNPGPDQEPITLIWLVRGREAEGLVEVSTQGGGDLVTALAVGLALGIGVALGDIIVEVAQRVDRSLVQPVVVRPVAGLVEGTIAWASRSRDAGEPVVQGLTSRPDPSGPPLD